MIENVTFLSSSHFVEVYLFPTAHCLLLDTSTRVALMEISYKNFLNKDSNQDRCVVCLCACACEGMCISDRT